MKCKTEVLGMIGMIEAFEEISLVPIRIKYTPGMMVNMILKDNGKRKDLKKGSVFWLV